MIQRLWLFGLIILAEAVIVVFLWFLATSLPLFYTFVVIITSLALLFWWRHTVWKEKQKIYDTETLSKQKRATLLLATKIIGLLLVVTYVGFLISVAVG
ncbi:hypothetical protein BREVNS_0235 [Brevinematales bacterium NS]|nr:hypothetical protein [Brevinematales bacterium]QJR20985.1 hypothetical protein BREVNS_0235 [Brevinematales bacterium NS]